MRAVESTLNTLSIDTRVMREILQRIEASQRDGAVAAVTHNRQRPEGGHREPFFIPRVSEASDIDRGIRIMEPAVTVLVVEDEAMLSLDYENALAEAGFAVIVATSEAKATRLLNEDDPVQGIVTDIRFAEPPDGWEVGRAARRIDAGIPVVYVSHAAADWPEKGVPNSIMLEKPFAMAQLVTAMAQLLSNRPPRET